MNTPNHANSSAVRTETPGSKPVRARQGATGKSLTVRWRAMLLLIPGLTGGLFVRPLAGPGSLDSTFDTGAGVEDGPVITIAVQPNGMPLLGGYFSSFNGMHNSGIVRLWGWGSRDDAFHLPGLGGHLHAVLPLPDGRILVGGDFVGVGEHSRIDVARLNPDGSPDPTFDAGSSSGQGHVDALARQVDGRIVVAGDFNLFDGAPLQGVVRLLPNGKLDRSFASNSGLVGHLTCLALDGEKIVVTGGFTNCHGAPRFGITRLNRDGSLDSTFQPAPGVRRGTNRASVNALVLQQDRKLVIGGDFTLVNSRPCNGIARLNPDGGLDTSFAPGAGIELPESGVVHALALQDDAKILVAGLLTEVDGVPRGGIIRLNRDGTLDTSFNASASANGVIRALAVLPGGNVLLAGHFTQLGGVAVGRIARLAGDFRPPNPDPLRLGSTSVSGVTARKLQFEVAGDVGRSYTVEFSEDLEVWRTLTNFVSVEANTVVPDPLLIDWPRRFYRVLTPR